MQRIWVLQRTLCARCKFLLQTTFRKAAKCKTFKTTRDEQVGPTTILIKGCHLNVSNNADFLCTCPGTIIVVLVLSQQQKWKFCV